MLWVSQGRLFLSVMCRIYLGISQFYFCCDGIPETTEGKENSFLLMVSEGSVLGSGFLGLCMVVRSCWRGFFTWQHPGNRKGRTERVQGKIEPLSLHPSGFPLAKVLPVKHAIILPIFQWINLIITSQPSWTTVSGNAFPVTPESSLLISQATINPLKWTIRLNDHIHL